MLVAFIGDYRCKRRATARCEKARYRIKQRAYFSLQWERNEQALRAERRVDGVFPLLCTNRELGPRKVLKAWKYQPRLEKCFEQFKHVHCAAPLPRHKKGPLKLYPEDRDAVHPTTSQILKTFAGYPAMQSRQKPAGGRNIGMGSNRSIVKRWPYWAWRKSGFGREYRDRKIAGKAAARSDLPP